MVTFSVCLLSPSPLLPHVTTLPFAPGSMDLKQDAHFGGKCEVGLSASWCPGTWLNIYQPNGDLSLRLKHVNMVDGARCLESTGERAKARKMHTLVLFITRYFGWRLM